METMSSLGFPHDRIAGSDGHHVSKLIIKQILNVPCTYSVFAQLSVISYQLKDFVTWM